MTNDERFSGLPAGRRRGWGCAAIVALLLSSFVIRHSSFAQVQIAFLPPPMEGTLSLGIYEKKGRLVRVLHREATEKDFTVGLNGFITFWDGKDDAGQVLPHGTSRARGYCVGALAVEGVAMHGNDWIADGDSPRVARVTDIQPHGGDEVEIRLKTLDGEVKTSGIHFTTESADAAAPAQTVTRDFPLGEGETAIDASPGAGERLWLIVQSAAGREVREYSQKGEFLRRLAYTAGEPQPQRIVASPHAEQIVLLDENAKVQRVRSLVLTAAPKAGDESLWKTVFEKNIWLGATFDAVKDQIQRPGGKPFAPEKEFVVKLIDNPLLKGEPATAHVAIGFDERGSFLQTTDGLPLRRITETPHLKWAVMGREGGGKLLTILQSDGAVIEEFRASKLANMMMFDAGDYEWLGK